MLRASLTRSGLGPPAKDAAAWDELRREVLRNAMPAEGRGVAAGGAAVRKTITLPNRPPKWVSQQISATGSVAGAPADLLKSQAAANAKAIEQLRSRVNELQLADNLTVGEAARSDPRFEKAVTRAVQRATRTQIRFDPPRGAASVDLSLPLDYVWWELNNAR